MPSLVRPSKTYFTLDGKRVPAGTPGARKVREKAAKWYGQGVPGHPPRKRFPLATDKQVARKMLADLVAGAERGAANMPAADAGKKPLAAYLEEFTRDVARGLATRSRVKRPPSAVQVGLTAQRVRAVLDGCRFAAVGDLNAAAPGKVAAYLQGRAAVARRDGGLSQQSAHFHLAAVKRFVWWLAVRAHAPVRAELLADVPGFDPKSDRRHARREIPPAELAAVLAAARAGRWFRGLSGEDRYFLYLTAFGSGFRANELSRLAPECFDLDAVPPAATLPARFAKNKRAARQMLPPGVAYQLRPYLAAKAAGVPVWPGTWRHDPAELLREDLAPAGVPYRVETPDGPRFADFHSLRHSFMTALAASGAGVKELQTLARHASPVLTIGVYTHARPEALAGAVARLPIPGAAGANPLAALTRSELEAAVVAQAALLAAILAPVAPPVAPGGGTDRDGSGHVGTAGGA